MNARRPPHEPGRRARRSSSHRSYSRGVSSDAAPTAADDAPSLVTNAALMWTMFVGRAAASLVTTVLVARALGPEGRGAVTSVVSLSGLLALIATAGMGVSMLRGLRLLHSHPRDLYSDALVVGLAWSALIGTALAAWAWLQPDQREMLLLTGVAVIPQVAQLSLANAATLDNRVWPVTWTTLVGVGGYASGTVVQIMVQDGQPVEYGEPLLVIE